MRAARPSILRRRRRITEIKHGRIAMAAFTGYLVQEVYKFPGYLSKTDDIKFEDVPNGLNAITVVPGLGWFQIIMVIGWLEAGPRACHTSQTSRLGGPEKTGPTVYNNTLHSTNTIKATNTDPNTHIPKLASLNPDPWLVGRPASQWPHSATGATDRALSTRCRFPSLLT